MFKVAASTGLLLQTSLKNRSEVSRTFSAKKVNEKKFKKKITFGQEFFMNLKTRNNF